MIKPLKGSEAECKPTWGGKGESLAAESFKGKKTEPRECKNKEEGWGIELCCDLPIYCG